MIFCSRNSSSWDIVNQLGNICWWVKVISCRTLWICWLTSSVSRPPKYIGTRWWASSRQLSDQVMHNISQKNSLTDSISNYWRQVLEIEDGKYFSLIIESMTSQSCRPFSQTRWCLLSRRSTISCGSSRELSMAWALLGVMVSHISMSSQKYPEWKIDSIDSTFAIKKWPILWTISIITSWLRLWSHNGKCFAMIYKVWLTWIS